MEQIAVQIFKRIQKDEIGSFAVVVVAQWLSHVQLFATPWTAAHQAPLSFTVSWSLLKFIFIEFGVVIEVDVAISLFVGLFSFCLQSFPASGSFPMSWLFTLDGQSIGALASVSLLPVNIQN